MGRVDLPHTRRRHFDQSSFISTGALDGYDWGEEMANYKKIESNRWPAVGDVFAIPLPDGRWGACRVRNCRGLHPCVQLRPPAIATDNCGRDDSKRQDWPDILHRDFGYAKFHVCNYLNNGPKPNAERRRNRAQRRPNEMERCLGGRKPCLTRAAADANWSRRRRHTK